MKRHHAAHEGREKSRCTVPGCGLTFRKHATLQKHILTVHEGRKPFVCEFLDLDGTECGAGFDTEGQLKSHGGRIHEMKTFLCTICSPEDRNTSGNAILNKRDVSFPTHAALREHIQNKHSPVCAECGQECKSRRDLKNHVEIFHGGFDANDSMTHSCPQPGCGRRFTKKGNLSMHIQISHKPDRFVCGEINPSTLCQVGNWDGTSSCEKALATRISLEQHIRLTHQGLARSSILKEQTKHGVAEEPARKHQVSILTRLTGDGYESGRIIPCLVVGCSHRFLRDYDLKIHLQSRHGLADLGVRETLMDQEGLYSRQTLQGTPTFATKQEVDAERPLDIQFDGDAGRVDGEESLRAGALKSADFWLGGQPYDDRGGAGEWLRDELEMRCLIDGGFEMEMHEMDDGQDVIDPALQ